jgi:branched-chain amino acid transport system permease protein
MASACAAAAALPLGLVMLRLNGIFFALGMFGLARIFQLLTSSLEVTGGPMGTSVPTVESPQAAAVAVVAVVAVAVLATGWISRSRLGLALMATRDDPVGAEAAGVDTWRARVIAYCISAAIAAAGGALYVCNVGYLDPGSAFAGTIELQTVLMVLAGGIGTVLGPVVGGVLISLLSTYLWARFPTEQQIVLGVLTIAVAVLAPSGLLGALLQRGWLRRPPIWGPPGRSAPDPVRADRPGIAAAEPVLVCRTLSVRFGGVRAVTDVDLDVRPGEMLAIIGPNGAGKSSLFNLMSAFHRPSGGEALLDGRSVIGVRPYRLARSGIARTFQTSRLFRSLSVWETVLVAAASVTRGRTDAVAETARILDRLGLLEQWADHPDTLSPGRQRLLEIARALALRPRVLLLDEAMAGMTPQEIARIHEALRAALDQGTAVIAIEHVLHAIAPLAGRVQVLDFGRTIAVGPPREVMTSAVVVEAYMGSLDAA